MSTAKALGPRIGLRLRKAIAATGTNQNQLAHAVGVTRAHINHLCFGTGSLSAHTLILMCRELGVSADWLLCLDGSEAHHS